MVSFSALAVITPPALIFTDSVLSLVEAFMLNPGFLPSIALSVMPMSPSFTEIFKSFPDFIRVLSTPEFKRFPLLTVILTLLLTALI